MKVTNAFDRAPVAEGDILAGKYSVERVLGAGGMGVVVAARHLQLDERVAIKFLRPEVAIQGAEYVARFSREGRAAVKIRSEHVARVTDVGTLETGSPYLVMEYLEGSDLARVLETQGPLPIDAALEYFLQACEALAEAHGLGIVHRDLKPANFFLTLRADGSPCIKLLDFGISKMAERDDAAMTHTRAVMGSPIYMSPEQMSSARNADARSDIWSLGVVLYELVTGKPPFEGGNMLELAANVLEMRQRPLRSVLPDAPRELEDAIAGCLTKDPAARIASVGDLVEALAPIAPERASVSIQRIARLKLASTPPRFFTPVTEIGGARPLGERRPVT